MEFVGPLRIKEGLFVGDKFAAQDLEFIVVNKVTCVVNCALRQVPNHWEPIGIKYLVFPCVGSERIVDLSDANFDEFYLFIERALTEGTSVLIHSLTGRCRSLCLVVGYFMFKYK